MIQCIKINSDNNDFQKLVKELDDDLRIRNGENDLFYAQFNKIDAIKYAIVAYENEVPIGCGAIKQYDENTMEIKRMYVVMDKRGNGIASKILKELEQWCVMLNYKKCLLETGKKQPEAIALYKKNNYAVIQNFGQYKGVEDSVCFEKMLM